MSNQNHAKIIKWMGPILDALRKLGGSGKPQDVINEIIIAQKVSEEERSVKIESGMSRFKNQVHWGRQYLVWEGLLESTQRGVWKLSEKGRTTHLTEEDSYKIFLKQVAISKGKEPSIDLEIQPDEEEKQNPYSIEQCAEDTGFDLEVLQGWIRAIERKGQAILYGPPGTGKTFMARALAKHLVSETDGFVDLVQFHPAYSYEDFIQGIRPQKVEGGLDYPTLPGRFLDFCCKAKERGGTCVLIIDEINRANLSRVFGELMYLLEYREEQVPLAGGGTFNIPANVRMIGTMNTADRSIALVDHALRRRFAFLPLYPNYHVLERFHQLHQTGFPIEKLSAILKNLNENYIRNPHYEVGISFFLRKTLSVEIKDIWQMEIHPYLEEFFFDQPANVKEFQWEKIQDQLMQ